MRKVKILKAENGNYLICKDGNQNIFCPLRMNSTDYNDVCEVNCAWFRIEENSTTGAFSGKEIKLPTYAYCGDKLIGEIVE